MTEHQKELAQQASNAIDRLNAEIKELKQDAEAWRGLDFPDEEIRDSLLEQKATLQERYNIKIDLNLNHGE